MGQGADELNLRVPHSREQVPWLLAADSVPLCGLDYCLRPAAAD